MRIFMVLMILFMPLSTNAQVENEIVGVWFNEEKDAKIEIYKQQTKFFGKIVWIKDPLGKDGKPAVDEHNPNPPDKKRPIIGLTILQDFVFDGISTWLGGTIYDPNDGKTYKCKIQCSNRNRLEVRGYVGIPLFGQTTVWTRAQ